MTNDELIAHARDIREQDLPNGVGNTIDALADALTTMQAREATLIRERDALRSALGRLDHNFDLLLAGKPVRDVAETKAETREALATSGLDD